MKKIVVIAILLLVAWTSNAQGSFVYFNWDVNIPTANTSWLDAASVKGAKFGYRKFIDQENRFSAGLDVAWATYDQYGPMETFQSSGGALTTDYFKYIYQKSFAISGQYYFKIDQLNWLHLYAGLGLGATQNKYRIFYNVYTDGKNSWGFLARPEAGILLRFAERRSIGALAAIHYDISTTQNKDYGYTYFSSVGFQVGIVLMTRY